MNCGSFSCAQAHRHAECEVAHDEAQQRRNELRGRTAAAQMERV